MNVGKAPPGSIPVQFGEVVISANRAAPYRMRMLHVFRLGAPF
jgi:hypothetical protein